MAEKKTVEKTESKFTKEQIVASRKYSENSDIVKALLEDDKKYTLEEVDSIIEKFKKGKEKVK